MEIVNKKTNELKPYDNNPRKNADAVPVVAESIKKFGFRQPIVIDSGGVIVCGHTRYKAAQMLGLQEVPCVIADDLTDEQLRAYRLADNKVAELAAWDSAKLQEELDKITEFDMSDFGFSLQIENIDIFEEGEQKIVGDMGEANNYVVMEFKTAEEWEMAKEMLELEEVSSYYKNTKCKKRGIGRVIEGKKILEKLQ